MHATARRPPHDRPVWQNVLRPHARVWSAPSTRRPGKEDATAWALARAKWRATAAASAMPDSGFNGTFVDLRRSDLKAQPGRRENFAANVTPRSKHERLGGKPKHHDHATGCRRRSLKSRITAAAVSSIERLVTSIVGQLCLAHSRREKEISSATAVLSIY